MSSIKLTPNSSGSGIFSIASPNSNTDRTLTLPDNSGTILTTATPGVPVNGPAFSATRSAAQSISATTWTKVQFSTEDYDTANCYDPTTNYRFTPNVAGYYLICATVEANTTSTHAVAIYKNGTAYRRAYVSNPGIGATAVISTLVYLNGSTDYVECYVWQSSAASLYTATTDYEFSGCLVRSA